MYVFFTQISMHKDKNIKIRTIKAQASSNEIIRLMNIQFHCKIILFTDYNLSYIPTVMLITYQ